MWGGGCVACGRQRDWAFVDLGYGQRSGHIEGVGCTARSGEGPGARGEGAVVTRDGRFRRNPAVIRGDNRNPHRPSVTSELRCWALPPQTCRHG